MMEENKLMEISRLNRMDTEILEENLERYDQSFIRDSSGERISLGIKDGDELIGGIDGQMTTFEIFYISTIFVNSSYRGKGLGRELICAIEKEAKNIGAKIIRLDSFSWQGVGFYEKLGYISAGHYKMMDSEYEEYFYYKYI